MKPSKGDDLEHPVTELEAVRSILVQGLPLLDQELTESSIVQVCTICTHVHRCTESDSLCVILVVSVVQQKGDAK